MRRVCVRDVRECCIESVWREEIGEDNQVIIDTPSQVWSRDITYIKLEKGFAYLGEAYHQGTNNRCYRAKEVLLEVV